MLRRKIKQGQEMGSRGLQLKLDYQGKPHRAVALGQRPEEGEGDRIDTWMDVWGEDDPVQETSIAGGGTEGSELREVTRDRSS